MPMNFNMGVGWPKCSETVVMVGWPKCSETDVICLSACTAHLLCLGVTLVSGDTMYANELQHGGGMAKVLRDRCLWLLVGHPT